MVRLELPSNFSSAVALVNAADSINALKKEGATATKTKKSKSPKKTPSPPSGNPDDNDNGNGPESTSVAELHSVSSTTTDPLGWVRRSALP